MSELDYNIMAAQADLIQGFERLKEHSDTLNLSSVVISFHDTTIEDSAMRKAFYKVLQAHARSVESLINLFEAICEASHCEYK